MAAPILPHQISAAYAREAIDYDPITGFMTWRVRPASHFVNEQTRKIWNKKWAGKRADHLHNGDEYRKIALRNKLYWAHRVAWLIISSEWPSHEIDHANGNRADNSMGNLRAVTPTENRRNSALRTDNTSGVTGISWDRRRRNWHARIYVNGECVYLGNFSEKDHAIDARKRAEILHGYSTRHGKKLSSQPDSAGSTPL